MGSLMAENPDNRQKGFTLIELLVVIGILAALAAVAMPAYSRFFGAGEVEANASELKLVQNAMDAMMAENLLDEIVPQDKPINDFSVLPTSASAPPAPTAESLFSGFLRNQATKCGYTWEATGRLTQYCSLPIPVSAGGDVILKVGENFEVLSGTFKGNIKTDALWNGTITVAAGANVEGNIESNGDGDIFVTVGTGKVFNGNIINNGNGMVIVSGPGTFNGNVRNEGTGTCTVSVGTHNGNEEGNCT